MDRDYISAPQIVKVEFALEPVMIQLESLALLNQHDQLSGFGNWVAQTYATMTPGERRENQIVFESADFIFYMEYPPLPEHQTIPEYVDWLFQQNLDGAADRVIKGWLSKIDEHPDHWSSDRPVPTFEQLRSERESFIEFMETTCERANDSGQWSETFDLLQQPVVWFERIKNHLGFMWENFLKDEWAQALPMLHESIDAFRRMPFENVTLNEAIRTVTGRDMRGKLGNIEDQVESVCFIPSPHIGPYVAKLLDDKDVKIVYGARLPRGVQTQSSALSRSELLIRMNALSDDVRLRILEMLTVHDEMCAQEIIERLGLSQSTVSRHLSQLSATGFLAERRKEANKCYSLNTDRVVDTVRALTNFLAKQQ
ncbi:MAG: winged helix-turn-helix transcriptional regulator [Anaerolineae bacterium]|nr:winged helix-turn-helix transcriptional regulator [Anaerolineae bacterium]